MAETSLPRFFNGRMYHRCIVNAHKISMDMIQWPSIPNAYETFEKLASRNRVWRARCHFAEGSVECTVRIITYDPSVSDVEDIMKSVEVLANINHPSVLKVQHWFLDQETTSLWLVYGQTSWTSLYELLEGSDKGLDEVMISSVMKQVLLVIVDIHKTGLAWYDIRPVHLLLSDDGSVRVLLHSLRAIVRLKTRDSLPFVAPEQLQPKSDVERLYRLRFKGDIWALGVTAVSLLLAHSPYDQMSLAEITEHIQNSSPLDEVKTTITPEFSAFLDLCFRFEPELRPTAEELLKHPFIASAPANGQTDFTEEGLILFQDGSYGPGAPSPAQSVALRDKLPAATIPQIPASGSGGNTPSSSTGSTPAVQRNSISVTGHSRTDSSGTGYSHARGDSTPSQLLRSESTSHVRMDSFSGNPLGLGPSAPTQVTSMPARLSTVASNPPSSSSSPSSASSPVPFPSPPIPTPSPPLGAMGSSTAGKVSGHQYQGSGPQQSLQQFSEERSQSPSTAVKDYPPTMIQASTSANGQGNGSASGQSTAPQTPTQSTVTSIPIECYLAESKLEFVVFIRAIPNTQIRMTLESRAMHISGVLPPLITPANEELVMRESVQRQFEKTLTFPAAVNANSFSKGYNKTASTLTIRIRKFTPVDLGTETF